MNLSYYYSDGYHFFENDTPSLRQKPYGLANASVSYTFPGGKYAIELWGENLGNTKSISNLNAAAAFSVTSVYNPPRTFGVRLSAKWGGA